MMIGCARVVAYASSKIPDGFEDDFDEDKIVEYRPWKKRKKSKTYTDEPISIWNEFKQAESDDYIESTFWDQVNTDIHSPWYDYIVTVM